MFDRMTSGRDMPIFKHGGKRRRREGGRKRHTERDLLNRK